MKIIYKHEKNAKMFFFFAKFRFKLFRSYAKIDENFVYKS